MRLPARKASPLQALEDLQLGRILDELGMSEPDTRRALALVAAKMIHLKPIGSALRRPPGPDGCHISRNTRPASRCHCCGWLPCPLPVRPKRLTEFVAQRCPLVVDCSGSHVPQAGFG